MGLETSTYISGLTNTWPVSGDPKSQGDDHIRLIKQVLQTTFPNASAPLYFPRGEAISGTITLDATDQNNVVMVTTTSGDVTVNLPTLTAAQAGWSCEVVKVTGEANAVVVNPPSGTILSQVGSTVNIRVGAFAQPARFIWSGSVFICVKPGAPIGSTQNFDAAAPVGYLLLDGSVYSSTTYRELFSAYGSTTLRDKRGRTEVGVDSGGLRLTSTYFGTAAVLGAVGGAESNTLAKANVPALSFSGTTGSNSVDHTHGYTAPNQATPINIQGGGTYPNVNIGGGSASTAGESVTHTHTFSGTTDGSGGAHANVQPTIVVNKYIRAC